MAVLRYPFSETAVRALTVGDEVCIEGRVFTGRDRLHRYLHDGHPAPVPLRDGALFHCGPVAVPDGRGGWRIVAAGPTTSAREEPYMAGIVAAHGVRAILGKGGMGPATVAACARYGCVYVQLPGGAAAAIAAAVQRVAGVWLLDDFGATEALWELEVAALDGIVGIDCHGRSLFETVRRSSRARLDALLEGAREPG